MKNILIFFSLLAGLCSCGKIGLNDNAPDGFTTYVIPAGNHSSNQSSIKKINLSSQEFIVRFDSSAIYSTTNPENQADINKLYGFTEGVDPHTNSARIGWAWLNGKLRLYAYVYHDKLRMSEEITAVNIGEDVACSIAISNGHYHFSINGTTIKLPRMLSTNTADGYQLYPYFGGDETAPHQITIRIKQAS